VLSASQLEGLREHGIERSAADGEFLFRAGDPVHSFIAIFDGEVAMLDVAENKLVRHKAPGFVGEMNLMTGQSSLLSARVMTPLTYVEVDRDVLRSLLYEDSSLADSLLTAFIERRELLQRSQGVGLEIVGPRDSAPTRELLDFARSQRMPFSWTVPGDEANGSTEAGLSAADFPLVRLPGGSEMRHPSNGELSRALGVGLELAAREEVDLLVIGGGPAGLGSAVYGASEGLDTLVIDSKVVGGQAGSSRRIENYLGFPAGISGTELIGRAASQAHKFGARIATPYRAESLERDGDRYVVKLDEGNEIAARAVVLATGAEYRRPAVADLDQYEGTSVFYAAGPSEARLCGAQRVGVVGGGNSAGQAAIWLARGGALVTLLHRRRDLSETMSSYLLAELEQYGVSVRGETEMTALHGADGNLERVTLSNGENLPFGFLFLFLGASPCTDWLGDTVARDDDGFVLTGKDAGVDGLLETSLPGVYAAGDARAGSIKRCATAVGEGASAVSLVHQLLAADRVTL
jgi:thioredoxin reductase (NADPH)